MNNKFYITTTLPYVNADPHIGFALEIVQADALARYHKLSGDDVFFNFGTDEHGLKIYRKAQEEKKDPQKYTDEYAQRFSDLKSALNLSYNNFIRTTDPHHVKAAQEFWKRCFVNGDIYKKNYRIKYCVGCELEKTDSELVDGKCILHPSLEIEIYDEENYFFKFSKYQKPLLEFYEKNPSFVVPQEKFNEIKTFVKNGLEDFSISRLKEKMPWGVDVPDDPEHVMYVWFDALVNYISALGWPENEKKFKDFWPGLQVAGKDNLRQQSAIWQAMLMSAGLPNSRQIFIHGFITVDGQKISKSIGNVVDPIALVKQYGTDAVRYYLLREIPSSGDGDYSERRFKEVYNADLANGLGNLVARVAKLCENVNYKFDKKFPIFSEIIDWTENTHWVNPNENNLTDRTWLTGIKYHIENFQFNESLILIWAEINRLDRRINIDEPWKLLKNNDLTKLNERLDLYIRLLVTISILLQPFLPETAEKILKQFTGKVVSAKPLFPRLA